MASKLEYLKKYLAKPGGEAEESRQPTRQSTDASRPGKEKKKRKKGSSHHDTMQIRDLSEVLPKARELAQPGYIGKQAKLLSLNLDDDEARLARDGELDYVDEEAVLQAAKIDVEKSGIGWKMQNHKKPSKQALRAPLTATKAEVVKEVKHEGSDSDMSPARPPTRGRGELSPPRSGATREQTARDDDLSPPRAQPQSKARADLSPARRPAAAKTMARRRKDSDDDMSPPRQGAAPAVVRKRADSDADLSPPRASAAAAKARHDSDADLSPPRAPAAAATARHDSDADLSPPRAPAAKANARHDSDADMSPPRAPAAKAKARHDSDADMSPPRRGKPAAEVKQEPDADLSPPWQGGGAARGRQRHDSDADMSPPRKSGAVEKTRQRHDSDADMSPPRKTSAASAPKRSSRHDSDADISPPRRSGKARHDSDADLSPPRKDEDEEKMSSGLRAGLVAGKALKEEAAEVRAARKAALAAAPDEETGKNADTVYRKRSGGLATREEWVDQQSKKRKKKMSEYPEQELAWGGGLKQQSNADEAREETTRVAAEPFARYEWGAEAINAHQEKQAWDDPMAKYDADEDAALAASSSAPPAVRKPKCPHPAWPNRFNIQPGYRWDGAVRGSNYEKRWLEAKNNRAFRKTEQYRCERLED